MPNGSAAFKQDGSVADREEQIRNAVDLANTNALRMALYQHTRDPELAGMRLGSKPIRGGALQMKTVADEDLSLLKDKAVALLRDGVPPTPPPPSLADTHELLRIFAGQEVSQANLDFAAEELAFEEFPRDVHWTNRPAPEVIAKLKVLVVGAGISGIAIAIQMQRLGLAYEVIERQDDLGGTWQLNNYPGARVDTSSYAYQFKFEKNYRWSEFFAARDETRKYLQHVATKHDVLKNFRFREEVTAATWHEDRAQWEVEITARDGGAKRIEWANFILTGTGLFATPNMPDIPGIETFEGRMFHTTQWDHDYDYAGKRVAQIGTGSTGVQLMTSVAEQAAHLTVYQRSANWITGVDAHRAKVPDNVQFLFDNLPYYWNWFCYSGFDTALQLQTAQTYDHDWRAKHGGVSEANSKLRENLTGYIRTKLASRPDLIEQVTPDHAPLGRRLVVDNGFYDALLRDNVELVTSGIERITPKGILGKDGIEREYDLIVLSAGFQVTKYLHPIEFTGRDGMTLEKAWAKDGARSFLGLAMPGFPNLFMLYGPQGQPRSGGFYSWAEVWARYAGEMIVKTLESGHRSADVRQPAFDDYNARLDEAGKEILWETEGKGSYFNNEFGRSQVNIPFRTEDYHAMVRSANLDDYELR